MLTRRSLLGFLGLGAPSAALAGMRSDAIPHRLIDGESTSPVTTLVKVDEDHWADLNQGVKKPVGIEVSSVPGSPGEAVWAKHCDAGGQWRVYLDGEDQYWFIAASEKEGWVLREISVEDTRGILTSSGRREVPILNPVEGKWVREVVYGDVCIEALNPCEV